jgi:hypothetical protein
MKRFLIIGNFNSFILKDIFPHIMDNTIWLGANKRGMDFITSDGTVNVNACWFTNLDNEKRHKPLKLTKTYNSTDYPKYDNYNDIIEVKKTNVIPVDYDGVMGVPITYIEKHNPDEFKIVALAAGNSWANYTDKLKELGFNPNMKYGGGLGIPILNGKALYTRLFIKRV